MSRLSHLQGRGATILFNIDLNRLRAGAPILEPVNWKIYTLIPRKRKKRKKKKKIRDVIDHYSPIKKEDSGTIIKWKSDKSQIAKRKLM